MTDIKEVNITSFLNAILLYWAQISFIALSIGYMFREWRTFYLKKMEINHSLFQKRKLDSVNEYMMVYIEYKQILSSISLYLILNGEMSMSELDNLITTQKNKVKLAGEMMYLYFDKDIFLRFQKITDELISIENKVHAILSMVNKKDESMKYSTDFEIFKIEKYKIIELLVSEVLCEVRKSMVK